MAEGVAAGTAVAVDVNIVGLGAAVTVGLVVAVAEGAAVGLAVAVGLAAVASGVAVGLPAALGCAIAVGLTDAEGVAVTAGFTDAEGAADAVGEADGGALGLFVNIGVGLSDAVAVGLALGLAGGRPPPELLAPPGVGAKVGPAVGTGFGAELAVGTSVLSALPGARGTKLAKAGLALPPPQPASAAAMSRGSSFCFMGEFINKKLLSN